MPIDWRLIIVVAYVVVLVAIVVAMYLEPWQFGSIVCRCPCP